MKLKAFTLAALLAIATPAMAEKTVYACQFIDSGGLEWKNGRWKPTGFYKSEPFFFSANNESIVPESMSGALGLESVNFLCHLSTDMFPVQTCSDSLGGVFIFNFNGLNGAIARVFSGVVGNSEKEKDPLYVSPFTCTKM